MPQVYKAIKCMFPRGRWRIFRDDMVIIRRGPEKGMTGRVLEVLKDTRVPQVVVEGLNLRKKRVQDGKGVDDFFVVTMEAPVHYSNVAVIDPITGRAVRTGFRFTAEGTRVRVGKGRASSGTVIPIPDNTEDQDFRMDMVGSKDTAPDVANKSTYEPTAGFPFRLPQLAAMFQASTRSYCAAACSSIPGLSQFQGRGFAAAGLLCGR
ncbi:MAG: hypothetical protein WDW36_002067 [Sanguina aurantia]